MKNKMNKNMFWNMIGSLTYVFASMAFLIVAVRINGTSEAGAFSIAFSLSSFLLCIGNYATRTFQVTENKIKDKNFILQRHITVIIMFVVALLYGIISGYDLFKITILILFILYKVLEAYSEILYAIIQKQDELYKAGKSLFLKGILGLLVFIVVNILTNNLIITLIALIVITLLIVIFYDLKNVLSYKLKKEKGSLKDVLSIFKLGFHPFLFSFLALYMMSAPRFGIDQYLSDDYQAIFGILMMPATLIILLSQFLIQPYLNTLKNYVKSKDMKKFNEEVNNVLLKVFTLGIILIVVFYLFGDNILSFIYGIDLKEYDFTVVIIVNGAILCGITYVLSACLTTLRKLKFQSIMYIIGSISAFIFTKYLVMYHEIAGASYAYLLSMIILAGGYIIYFIYISKDVKQIKKSTK